MPFVPSSDAQFEAQVDAYRINGVQEDNPGDNLQAHANEFVAYQARADIESRQSILRREQALPGTILWENQASQNEVDTVITPA